MQAVLLDSSVYVAARRAEDSVIRIEQVTAGSVLWLSAVVLEELYAGVGVRDREYVEQLERGFRQAAKILVPSLEDWVNTGKVLAQLATKYHYQKVGRNRLTNDALIAASTARMKIQVITTNARDFLKLAEFSSVSWDLVTL